jgi:hypothetical protein
MAVDITIDSIIRRNLAKRTLPLHYYGPMLVMAKEGLDEMHFDSLQKVKIATLPLDADLKTADLPDDFVEEISVGIETGDKVRPIGYNHRINKRDDEGTPFPEEPDLYTLGTGYVVGGTLLENIYNEYLGYKGRNFGRPVTFTDSYTILRELGKIRVDNKSTETSVQLIYLSLPEKVTNKSVIHPFAKKTLDSYLNWQWEVYNKGKDQELRRRDFYNDYRILRARKNKMTTTEIKRIVRNKIVLSIKN